MEGGCKDDALVIFHHVWKFTPVHVHNGNAHFLQGVCCMVLYTLSPELMPYVPDMKSVIFIYALQQLSFLTGGSACEGRDPSVRKWDSFPVLVFRATINCFEFYYWDSSRVRHRRRLAAALRTPALAIEIYAADGRYAKQKFPCSSSSAHSLENERFLTAVHFPVYQNSVHVQTE